MKIVDYCSPELLRENISGILEVLNNSYYNFNPNSPNARLIADYVISDVSKYPNLISKVVDYCSPELLKINIEKIWMIIKKSNYIFSYLTPFDLVEYVLSVEIDFNIIENILVNCNLLKISSDIILGAADILKSKYMLSINFPFSKFDSILESSILSTISTFPSDYKIRLESLIQKLGVSSLFF